MLQALSKGHPCIPKDASPRYQHLCALDMMLDGTLYDHLPPFHVELHRGRILGVPTA